MPMRRRKRKERIHLFLLLVLCYMQRYIRVKRFEIDSHVGSSFPCGCLIKGCDPLNNAQMIKKVKVWLMLIRDL